MRLTVKTNSMQRHATAISYMSDVEQVGLSRLLAPQVILTSCLSKDCRRWVKSTLSSFLCLEIKDFYLTCMLEG